MPERRSRRYACAAASIGAALLSMPLAGVAHAQARPDFQRAWQQATPITLTGTVTVVVADDVPNRRSEVIHSVRDEKTGQSFRLTFERQAPAVLRTGARITVHGRRQGAVIYLASTDGSGSSVQTLQSSSTTQSAAIGGDQKTLVVVANFRDSCIGCTLEAINDMMFADPGGLSVDALYRETSHGQVSFSGAVVGPYTIDAASTDPCDYPAWGSAADAQAAAAGVDVSSYPRKLYVMPRNSCPGSGFGQLGGTQTAAWVFDCQTAGLYAHELGHNLGMQHASTPASEYGDTSDAMGLSDSWLTPMNAPHRQQLGWLPPSTVSPITQSGTYDLTPLAADPSVAASPQVLTIFKPDTREYYYVSYRHGIGFDNYVDGSYRERVSVHRYPGDGTAAHTYLLGALIDGESFVDQVNGISVTLLAHDTTHASVRIDPGAGASACTAGGPVLSLSPQSQGGTPGSTLTYSVSLSNADAAACAAGAFALTAAAPPGWSIAVSPTSLSLAPGTTGQATLTVTSPPATPVGTYTAAVNATDGTTAAHNASASAAYTVSAPCVSQAPTVSASPADQNGVPGNTLTYSIALTNNDSGGCASSTFATQAILPAGWAASLSTSSITLAPGESRGFSMLATSSSLAAPGDYTVAAGVFDPAQTQHAASAPATYTVLPGPDTQAPSAPGKLAASYSQKLKQVQLSWAVSTDNVGVTGYLVYRDGMAVAMVTTTAFADAAVMAGGSYTYYVKAYDAAGNVSVASNSVAVAVSAGGKKR